MHAMWCVRVVLRLTCVFRMLYVVQVSFCITWCTSCIVQVCVCVSCTFMSTFLAKVLACFAVFSLSFWFASITFRVCF